MILACSLCNTRYLVAAGLFEEGPRLVRCGRCMHTWQACLPTDGGNVLEERISESGTGSTLPPLLLESAPPPTADEKLVLRTRRRRNYGVIACVVLFLLWIAYDRQEIATNRPFMEKLYNTIGLRIYHYHGEGLSFEQVRSELKFDGGLMKLSVEGKIHNGTEFEEQIPDILASAIGPDGQVMQSWQIDAPATKVEAGDAVPFTSSITAPKGTVVDLNLSFIEIKTSHE